MNTKPPRYAHDQGQVGLCFDDSGDHIITCGSEGDVRIFEGFDDDDALTHRVGDTVYAVAYKNYRFYTAADDNAVQIRIFKEGEPDGILTRFTAPVTALCFSKDGTKAIAGSSDFTVKIINVDDSSQKLAFEHEAPLLCVCMNPQETLFASSSCDGTVKIYSFNQEKVIHTITGLPKSNDISTTKTLSRISWEKDGKCLCIPVEKEIRLYSSENWSVSATLTHPDITEFASIVTVSECGKYLAVATHDGHILIFDLKTHKCIAKDQHGKKLGITGLAWRPNEKVHQVPQLAWVDNHGNLGVYEDFIPKSNENKVENKEMLNADQLQELFEDVDDDMLIQATNVDEHQIGEGDSSDDNDDAITQGHNKSRVRILEDDGDSMDVPGSLKGGDDGSVVSEKNEKKPAPVVIKGFEPTPLQNAFQSGSTPVNYAHRFMLWNSVGVVMQYNTDEESSINIEFHDTATHHALHVPNTMGHTMADLSSEAVALACESDEDTPSKLVCMHFSSWDSCKEWSVPLPEGEEIEAVTLGDGWVAVATDQRLVRVFSVGGLQKEVFSIPGPVVTMAGHTHQLILVFHKGMGIPGDQCLGVRLLTLAGKRRTIIAGDDLPISCKSTLSWLGFSAEGTPFTIDSKSVVRMLNRSMGNNWVQVADLKKHCKGKSDSYFVVGIHENPQQLRAVLCKGSRHPPTLPRPNVNILPFEIPLCEMSTEKGVIEENYWRSRLLSQHFDWLSSNGFEIDEVSKSRAVMPQQEALMKLFALACKTEREFRAVEICEIMPSSHTVQLAIKYASRVRLAQLTSRLGEVARSKVEEEQMASTQEQEEDNESDEEYEIPKMQPLKSIPKVDPTSNGSHQVDAEEEDMEDVSEEEGDISEILEHEELEKESEKSSVPMLKLNTGIEKPVTPKPISTSQIVKKNPFKVASQKTPTGQGSRVFDNIESRPKSTSKLLASPDPLAKRPRVNKKITDQKKAGSVTKMFTKADSVQRPKSKSGFQLWFEENKNDLEEEHPDVDEIDLTKIAAKAFKDLSNDTKREWNDKASDQSGDQDSSKKRKRNDCNSEDQENSDDTQIKIAKKDKILDPNKPLSQQTSSKLAAFSFNKP